MIRKNVSDKGCMKSTGTYTVPMSNFEMYCEAYYNFLTGNCLFITCSCQLTLRRFQNTFPIRVFRTICYRDMNVEIRHVASINVARCTPQRHKKKISHSHNLNTQFSNVSKTLGQFRAVNSANSLYYSLQFVSSYVSRAGYAEDTSL